MDQHKTCDIQKGNFSNRNQNEVDSGSTEDCFAYTNIQSSSSDSEVTRLIKDSIARSNQTANNVSFETTVRQLTVATSNIINEMPKVAARTVQIANKIVSVGKDSLNTINQIKNNISPKRQE